MNYRAVEGGGGKKDGIPGSRRRMQTYILTYLGVILTYSGFKERPFDSSGSSADGILNSTSAVPQRSIETVNKEKRTGEGGSGRGYSTSLTVSFYSSSVHVSRQEKIE